MNVIRKKFFKKIGQGFDTDILKYFHHKKFITFCQNFIQSIEIIFNPVEKRWNSCINTRISGFSTTKPIRHNSDLVYPYVITNGISVHQGASRITLTSILTTLKVPRTQNSIIYNRTRTESAAA